MPNHSIKTDGPEGIPMGQKRGGFFEVLFLHSK